MGLISKTIVPIKEPKLELFKLEISDIESKNSDARKYGQLSNYLGSDHPLIVINGIVFYYNAIRSFVLSSDGFLPTINCVLEDATKTLDVSGFPRDGDVLQLYISSNNNIYKPIRIDFDITNITYQPAGVHRGINTGQEESEKMIYFIEGIMKIDELYAEENYAFPKDTSFNHLLLVADKLKIGFSSNIENTKDPMIRINPNLSHLQFIQNIIEYAYNGDDAFLTGFIDFYYYLNFIDLHQQLNYDDYLEDSIINFASAFNNIKDGDDIKNFTQGKLFLTNHPKFVGTNNYISKYNLINEGGNIMMMNGYARYVDYYSYVDKKNYNFKIESLNSDNIPSYLFPLKGNIKEDRYKKIVKKKFLGIQSDNVFDEYLYSYINNYQNYNELFRLYLNVQLNTQNLSIYRMQYIPVIIYELDARRGQILNNLEQLSEQNSDFNKEPYLTEDNKEMPSSYATLKINRELSGFYIIGSMNLHYRAGQTGFLQELKLYRREWNVRI